MAIVKLTASGKAVLFVDDDGNAFMVSKTFIESMLKRGKSHELVLLSRLPNKLSSEKFRKSPLMPGMGSAVVGDNPTPSSDAMSRRGKDDIKQAQQYADKLVDW